MGNSVPYWLKLRQCAKERLFVNDDASRSANTSAFEHLNIRLY